MVCFSWYLSRYFKIGYALKYANDHAYFFRDLKTYFLRDINELLSMNKTEFHRILHLLDVNKGNNSVVHTKFRKKMLRGLNISKQELQLLPEHKQFGGF